MELRIRAATPEDAPQIWTVHTASIRELCSSAYSKEQIQEWSSMMPPERFLEPMEKFSFVVAEDETGIVGFCIFDAETAEMDALYVAPWATGRKIGRALLVWAVNAAQTAGLPALWLTSTLNAVAFYEHFGFESMGVSTRPLPTVPARACVLMKKDLQG